MISWGRILKTLVLPDLSCFCILVCLLACSVPSAGGCSELPLVSGNFTGSTTLQAGNPSVVCRQRSVFINPDLFVNTQAIDVLQLNLFEDVRLQAVRNKTQGGARGSVLWTGVLAGAGTGSVVLITRDQRVSATVSLPSVTYQIRPLDNGMHLIRQIDTLATAGLERIQPGMPPEEWKIMLLVNRERAAEGLETLQCNEALSMASRDHAAEMALGNYYSHDRRDGRKFYERIFETGYPVSKCGENIAVGFAAPEEVFEGWINSPEHRANILNCDFTEMGVGNAVGNNKIYWAQEFGAGRKQDSRMLKLAAGPSPLDLFRSVAKVFGKL